MTRRLALLALPLLLGGCSLMASSGPTTLVQTGTAAVNGVQETVLTDAQGQTLYIDTADGPLSPSCVGPCTQVWPPLLSPSGRAVSAPGLGGMLTVTDDANGAQVQYNGHFLYLYSGDSAPGQANGQNIGGFLVATPNLPQLSPISMGPTFNPSPSY